VGINKLLFNFFYYFDYKYIYLATIVVLFLMNLQLIKSALKIKVCICFKPRLAPKSIYFRKAEYSHVVCLFIRISY